MQAPPGRYSDSLQERQIFDAMALAERAGSIDGLRTRMCRFASAPISKRNVAPPNALASEERQPKRESSQCWIQWYAAMHLPHYLRQRRRAPPNRKSRSLAFERNREPAWNAELCRQHGSGGQPIYYGNPSTATWLRIGRLTASLIATSGNSASSHTYR